MKLYCYKCFEKFKYFVREILKDQCAIYQNHLLNKSNFYNDFNEFQKKNSGFEKIYLTLNHLSIKNKINPEIHFKYLKNSKVTKNGYHSLEYNRIKDKLPADQKKSKEIIKTLKILPNPNYFKYMNSFGVRSIIFDKI